MFLRNAIEEVHGLRFIMDNLDIQSGLAKRILYTLPYCHEAQTIREELNKIEFMLNILQQPDNQEPVTKINIKLMQVKDIRGTVARIGESRVLDDIELFELKTFSLLTMELRSLLIQAGITILCIPDLEPVVNILDPEKRRIPHFYIYDAYSEELAQVRATLKELKITGQYSESDIEKLHFQGLILEDKIRESLAGQILPYREEIATALDSIAQLDILLAKAKQAIEMHLCKPEIAATTTRYTSIFNPQIKDILHKEKKNFQAIDIEIGQNACLITGANMAGKSVILKTVALSQTLFQFGFYVPARQAEIALVDEILLCIGDDQCELNGLSSFAAEMLRVNHIIQDVKAGKNVLILIDELARTTNPTEGKAIVNAMLNFLTTHQTRSLITSHYSGIKAPCRKLRVKGFVKEKIEGQLTIQNINEYIDYSLMEDNQDSVPHEAMRIARILGVDDELLDQAETFLLAEQKQNGEN